MRVAFVLFALVAFQAIWVESAAPNKQKKEVLTSAKAWDSVISKIQANAKRQNKVFKITDRILAGSEFSQPLPYFASITDETKLCGGALVHPNYVLTSASCVDYVSNPSTYIGVLLGFYSKSVNTNVQMFSVSMEAVNKHPQYDCVSLQNDIAAIYLSVAVTITAGSVDVVSVYGGVSGSELEGYAFGTVGWGSTSATEMTVSSTLKSFEGIVKPVSFCQTFAEFADMDPDQHICGIMEGSHGGACWGDEGGPLIMMMGEGQQVLVGITSYQPYMCPAVGFPSRYTRIGFYFGWLSQWFSVGGGGGGSGGACLEARRMRMAQNFLKAQKKSKNPKDKKNHPKGPY